MIWFAEKDGEIVKSGYVRDVQFMGPVMRKVNRELGYTKFYVETMRGSLVPDDVEAAWTCNGITFGCYSMDTNYGREVEAKVQELLDELEKVRNHRDQSNRVIAKFESMSFWHTILYACLKLKSKWI